MISTLDKENNRINYTNPIVLGDGTVFSGGIDCQKIYKLNYQFDDTGHKREIIKGMGVHFCTDHQMCMNTLFDNPDWDEKTRSMLITMVPRLTTVLYGTHLLRPKLFNKLFNEYKENVFGPELGPWIKKGIKKGKGEENELVRQLISTYIWSHINRRDDDDQDTLTIHDSPSCSEEYIEEIKNNWKDSNLAKRFSIKSWDVYKTYLRNGYLKPIWTTNNLGSGEFNIPKEVLKKYEVVS